MLPATPTGFVIYCWISVSVNMFTPPDDNPCVSKHAVVKNIKKKKVKLSL
jgi:hypothetical protein